jgi:flagellar protein FliJ
MNPIEMKRRDPSLVAALCQARTTGQSIASVERALIEMRALAVALDRFVAEEEARTHVTDVEHFTYSTAARAARVRSNNLKKSLIELKDKLHRMSGELQRIPPLPVQETRQMPHDRLPTSNSLNG